MSNRLGLPSLEFITGTLKARTQCSDCQRYSLLATLTLIRKKKILGNYYFRSEMKAYSNKILFPPTANVNF